MTQGFPRDARVVPAPDQISADLSGEFVILSLSSGRYHGLVDVGARVWALICEGATVGRIHDTLVAEFEVDAAQCRRDLEQFLRGLLQRRLVERSPATSG